MTRLRTGLAASAVLAAIHGTVAQQAGLPGAVTASVAVMTSSDRRIIAVLSKDNPPFLYCIDLPAPLPEKISYSGKARVVYRLLPKSDIPAGVKVDKKEEVASAFAVLPSDGKGWLFLARNEKSVLSPGEAGAGAVTTVILTVVRRLDWVPADGGPRRGMEVEGCFEEAG